VKAYIGASCPNARQGWGALARPFPTLDAKDQVLIQHEPRTSPYRPTRRSACTQHCMPRGVPRKLGIYPGVAHGYLRKYRRRADDGHQQTALDRCLKSLAGTPTGSEGGRPIRRRYVEDVRKNAPPEGPTSSAVFLDRRSRHNLDDRRSASPARWDPNPHTRAWRKDRRIGFDSRVSRAVSASLAA